MRRRLIAAAAALGLFAAVAAAPASADRGTPGSTFPEQPAAHLQTACAALATNPGTGGGRLLDIVPPRAGAILFGNITDACTFN